MTLHAAWKIENLGVKEAREDIALIKFFVAGVMQNVIDRALQVHGGLGMTDDTIISFFYRHERAARIYDGPDEVHKMSVAQADHQRLCRAVLCGKSGDFLKKGFTACEPFFMVNIKLSMRKINPWEYIDKTQPIPGGVKNLIWWKVEAFLKDSIPGLQGKLTVGQFPGGHSNLTYLLKIGDREMVFRRPPLAGKRKRPMTWGGNTEFRKP